MTDNKVVNATVVEESTLSAPKTKKHLSLSKKLGVALAVLAIACCTALSVSATDPETSAITTTEQIETTMVTSFNEVKDDVISVSTKVLPAGLGVFALGFCVRKGIGFFRTTSR